MTEAGGLLGASSLKFISVVSHRRFQLLDCARKIIIAISASVVDRDRITSP